MNQRMSIVRIKTRVESDTLHLPELRSMIGKDVEIVVTDESDSLHYDESFWKGKTLDELAAEQGITSPTPFEKLLGRWPGEIDDGFEEALLERRREDLAHRKPS